MVDAMGGDGGLETSLGGMAMALDADPGLHIVACGRRDEIEAASTGALNRHGKRFSVTAADEVLPADASPAQALRHGRNSSLWQALECLRSEQAEALVSAGGTGALLALSRQILGTLPGVERPALMAALPSAERPVWVLDLGANLNVDARRLLEFAQLGSVAVEVLEGREPCIGVLNVGSEPGKGPDVVREAARLIDADPALNYQGFIEADAVFAGRVDLVVCDGFSGNVLLKAGEGAVRLVLAETAARFRRSFAGWLGRSRFAALHDSFDPARHNGAPLLGLRGTVIKSHGGAGSDGFARAIALAALEARQDLVSRLEKRLWADA